jgi:hypothetical protein
LVAASKPICADDQNCHETQVVVYPHTSLVCRLPLGYRDGLYEVSYWHNTLCTFVNAVHPTPMMNTRSLADAMVRVTAGRREERGTDSLRHQRLHMYLHRHTIHYRNYCLSKAQRPLILLLVFFFIILRLRKPLHRC